MSKSGGGAATAGGMDFQHRVAAWIAVHVLAEKDATPLPYLPADTTLEWLRCETEQPVDDLLVGTSANGIVFAQIKHTLQLTEGADSDLASALGQFVRQFVACRGKTIGTQPWDRPLDPVRDRLVLITSPTSSVPVRVYLPAFLRRLRGLLADQPLDCAAVNIDERRVLSTVQQHVTNSWVRVLGTAPSDDELRQLLSLVHVLVLNVDEEGGGKREARALLRSSILRNPDEDEVAWAWLVSLCGSLASTRSGAARLDLQRELLSAGLQLRAPRSYQSDIERLGEYSATTFDALAHLAQIRVNATTIKIHRACTDALLRTAEENSLLVVGEPGAGKSGTLHDLTETLRREGRDCVFLAVDRLAAQSLGSLRGELGLGHELPEVLDNWAGIKPGFLVIDALDAARGDNTQRMIQDLIRRVIVKSTRWRVVVSIRKFDLRYGVEIKELFAGAPPSEFNDPEFIDVRHLNVPQLSEEDLSQIASQSPELHRLINTVPVELHNLLRVPFNLRLMADLLGAGVSRDELTPIKTQLGLLDRYWLRRVVRDDRQGDDREAIIRSVCERMVAERALRVNRSDVVQLGTGVMLDDLLREQLLIEWQPSPGAPPDRYILAFSHHVLFDYAVARLLLRVTPEKVVYRLAADPNLVIMIRPSLVLHFRLMWSLDSKRHHFWGIIFRVIQEPRIPEISKLIGPSVAAELTKTLLDMEPLSKALEDHRSERHSVAEQALRHLVGALMTGEPSGDGLIGPGAGPWCALLERVSRSLRRSVAYTIRPILTTICAHPGDFTTEQRIDAGHTARRLLEFAWSQPLRDQWLIVHAIECLCHTFESDPSVSAALIRRCLEPAHLSQYGFEEMPWLTREVKRLIDFDPALVEEICRVAFAFNETSDQETPMGQSRIMSLISNRRQDYRMARYELAKVFPTFLERAPENATRALIAVAEAYIAQRRTASAEEHDETFDFNGCQARIRSDHSVIWDEGDTYRHDEPLKMLDAFEQYLEKLAGQPEASERLREIVEIIVSKNHLAVLWRRVLRVAARKPATLGRQMLPLAWAIPILTCYDTTTTAGEFLKVIFVTLGKSERERTERVILSIPEAVPADRREAGEHVRNRLLGCLTDVELVTDEAQLVLEQLTASNAIPPNIPPVRFTSWSRSYGEEEYLRDLGVPIEEEPNREIRELERPVKEFGDKHLNSSPSLEDISVILASLQRLSDALSRADAKGVHEKQRDHAWGYLAAACARAARADGLSCEDEPGAFIGTVLLQASYHPEPTHDPQYDAQFDDFPSWGSPAPRIEAAHGIVLLAGHPACSTPDILKALERLSRDSVPAIRFQIASSLNVLYRTEPELMWSVIEHMCQGEASRGVLQGLLGSFQMLAGVEPDRAASLTKVILNRVREGSGADRVRELCVRILAGLYIWRDHAPCSEAVLAIAANPADYPSETGHLIGLLREPLTYGPTHPADPEQDAVRHRALDLLDRVLRSTREGLREIELRNSPVPFVDWPRQDQEAVKSLARLIDHAGSELYFASETYGRKGQGYTAEDMPLTRERAERFYHETGSILGELADVGIPSVTHHLLETLEFFIPFDPRGVFLCMGRVVRAGQQGSYQYESLAADLIVKLVERYLAEYRTLLREDEECRRTLVEILDMFVQVGWSSARQLTYRLEDIFR